ncbi:SDR family NAD(P)-dependent oxidoreductase [Rhodococcus erythropolis]|uniref:SDR family NAD(P)-dependent oxidoreductase n=1 Tax=Rhodococcus erythropolis TaxID=1833 RepID=UPI00301400D9
MTDIAENIITTPSDLLARGRDFDVRDRVVVITGGGQGIGREYARQLGAAGAIPVIADVNADSGARVAEEVRSAGGRALAIATNVADADSVQNLIDGTVEEFGRIDVLVNNAAIFSSLAMRPFEEIPVDEWRSVIDVNVTGTYLCARAVAPVFKKAGWGRIINIASGAVPLGVPNYLHYVASKAAITGITNSLARELGKFGITVNAVQPGGTFTEVPRETVTAEGKVKLVANQCIPREEVPADLSGAVIFLCTNAAEFITGQTIVVDGGLTHK